MRKKTDKKVAFLLTFLLMVAVLLVYANLKFTGLVVDENLYDCGDWSNVAGQCGERECISKTNSSDIVTDSKECICTEDWECSNWTECVDSAQTRTCEDLSECGTEDDKPIESQECAVCGNSVVETGEDCEGDAAQNCTTSGGGYAGTQDCSNCILGECITTESCGDTIINGNEACDLGSDNNAVPDWSEDGTEYCNNNCELILGPRCGDGHCSSDNEDCDSCEEDCACGSGYTCDSGDCVEEEEEEEEETSSESESTTSGGTFSSSETSGMTGSSIEQTCVPDWECGEWAECVNETQDRICTDLNQCDSNEGMPETSQSCVVIIEETCFDRIKNQDEEGIDCGGSCEKKCSFFTIVGSAVSGPIDASKNFVLKGMFGNMTKSIISIAALVLIIGGIVVAVLFEKKIIKFPLKKQEAKNENL